MKNLKLITISVVFICMVSFSSSTFAFFGFFEDSYVSQVKNGEFSFDNSITVADAFEGNQYFLNPTWKSIKDSQNRNYVEFTADINLPKFFTLLPEEQAKMQPKIPVTVTIQFIINRDDSFDINHISLSSEFGLLYEAQTDQEIIDVISDIYRNKISFELGKRIVSEAVNGLVRYVAKEDLATVKKLISYGADPNLGVKGEDFPLMIAVQNNNTEIAKYLIQNGANVNIRNKRTETPLMVAILQDNEELVAFLLENEANCNMPTTQGLNPIMAAMERDKMEIVKMLIKAGANVSSSINSTKLLLKAIEKKEKEIFKMLVVAGADLNSNNANMFLVKALESEEKEIVKFIVEKGGDLDNTSYGSPLCIAIKNNDKESAQVIINAGASVNKNDLRTGESPLHIAVRNNNIETVKLLLQKGADVNAQNMQTSKTPLWSALVQKNIALVALLLENGAEVDNFSYLNATNSGIPELSELVQKYLKR